MKRYRRNGEVIAFPGRAAPQEQQEQQKEELTAESLLAYLRKNNGSVSAADLAGAFRIYPQQASALLEGMESRGLLESVKTVVTRRKVYFVPREQPSAERASAEREASIARRKEADARASTQSRYKVNDVVVIRGGRRRYVVAHVEPNYGGEQTYYITALSGSEAGSAPSGVRESELTKSKDQTVEWSGPLGHKLRSRYVSAMGQLGRTPEKIVQVAEGGIKIDPGVTLARRVSAAVPRTSKVSTPQRGKAVVWVTRSIEPKATYAKRLWETYESLVNHGLTVSNIEPGLGRIIVVESDDPRYSMPAEKVWEEFARASKMSGEKENPARRRNPFDLSRPPRHVGTWPSDMLRGQNETYYYRKFVEYLNAGREADSKVALQAQADAGDTPTMRAQMKREEAARGRFERRNPGKPEFDRLYAAAEAEMRRLHPKWSENTLTWVNEHTRIMRQMAKSGPRAVTPRSNPGERRASSQIQTLLFPTAHWSVARARDWARKHGKHFGSVDESADYIHLRQHDPSDYRKGSLRTIEIAKHVEAVVGVPLPGSTAAHAHGYGSKGPRQARLAFRRGASGSSHDVIW